MDTNKQAFMILVNIKVVLNWCFCDPGKLSFPKMGHLHYLYVTMATMTPVNQIKKLYFLLKMTPAQVKALQIFLKCSKHNIFLSKTMFRDYTLKMFSQKWFFA